MIRNPLTNPIQTNKKKQEQKFYKYLFVGLNTKSPYSMMMNEYEEMKNFEIIEKGQE